MAIDDVTTTKFQCSECENFNLKSSMENGDQDSDLDDEEPFHLVMKVELGQVSISQTSYARLFHTKVSHEAFFCT
jgi:hypothetical protein